MSDLTCQRCGGGNPVWWAPDDLWNHVVGTPENPRGEGVVLCPSCFCTFIDPPTPVLSATLRAAAAVPDRAATTEGDELLRHYPDMGRRIPDPAAPTEGAGKAAYWREQAETWRLMAISRKTKNERLRAECDALRDTVRRIEALCDAAIPWTRASGVKYLVADHVRAALVPPSPGDGEPDA